MLAAAPPTAVSRSHTSGGLLSHHDPEHQANVELELSNCATCPDTNFPHFLPTPGEIPMKQIIEQSRTIDIFFAEYFLSFIHQKPSAFMGGFLINVPTTHLMRYKIHLSRNEGDIDSNLSLV